jgi:hypothetical protein
MGSALKAATTVANKQSVIQSPPTILQSSTQSMPDSAIPRIRAMLISITRALSWDRLTPTSQERAAGISRRPNHNRHEPQSGDQSPRATLEISRNVADALTAMIETELSITPVPSCALEFQDTR